MYIEQNSKVAMQSIYPESFARFYDLIYEHLREGVDNEFFLKYIAEASRTLEIGAGTGRFFIDALESGSDIYGIDVSEHMLGVLKSKLPPDQHYRISLQDFRDFSFDRAFNLVIAPFRVFMHIPEKNDQLAALDNAYGHLEPGGLLIFDAFVPKLEQLIEGLNEHTDFESEYEPGKIVKRTVSTKSDLIRQIISIRFRIEWDSDEGWKEETWDTELRFFFRYELEHLLERSKFENYDILGDYNGNPLDINSKEFIVICRKN
jgi:SAM-dependent methyltransferase